MDDSAYNLVVDIDAGIKRFAGKRERYMSSLLKFADSLLSDRSEKESRDQLHEVHSIKGVAGNLGIISLYDAAVKFERLLKSGQAPEKERGRFYDICAATGKAILEQFDNRGNIVEVQLAKGADIEYSVLKSMLARALTEGDISTAEEVVAELRLKNWPGHMNIDQICKLVESYEFDEALKLL